MKEALFYSKELDYLKCELCAHNCIIKEGKTGLCGVRKNVDGKLFSISYGRIISPQMDAIEKKPLYHFFPGSKTFSFGTYGCNFKCVFCQNHHLSYNVPENYENYDYTTAQEVVSLAKKFGAHSIAYTYNEPTVFAEFILETARLAKNSGLKNVMVTNGYTNPAPIKELCLVIDAVNIDLKSFSNTFYSKNCSAKLSPVKQAIEQYHKNGVWVEITNLVIPGENDLKKDFEHVARWIASVNNSIPLHLTRFYPFHKMVDKLPTPIKTLEYAKEICSEFLDYVYVGNVSGEHNTFCSNCGKNLIKRSDFSVKTFMRRGECSCGAKLQGCF
ncbi:MAG: AmmeMemoRadiSam system radical SAM enzyme [Nanoarchaeota archaeon]|nr:AmmeMemoRadiSam system radical SAM enzyme [Nanoarchaeota archaeon]